MYRIKLTSGDEANYGSIDELAQAVKAGTVTDTAAIYHARAEKWLPIASHPHYKMAKDRAGMAGTAGRPGVPGGAPRSGPAGTNGGSGVRAAASGQRPAVTASGQRPAIGASAQRPAANGTAPRTAVATAPRSTAPQPAMPAPSQPVARVTTAERPVRAPVVERRTAPQQAVPRPPVVRVEAPAAEPAAPSGLDLLRADAAIEQDSSVKAQLPEVELEQTPTIEEPQVVAPAPASEPIEQVPESVHLVSNDRAPAAGGIELIHPDRAVAQEAAELVELEVEPVAAPAAPAAHAPVSLDIPASVHEFPPVDPAELHAVGARSRAPLYIGLGLAAAAAIGALVFIRKPASPAPQVTDARTAPSAPAPVAPAPAQVGTADSAAVGQQDEERRQTSSNRRRRDTEPDPNGADGLEPPPRVVIPAAPSVTALTDAAALPTVEAEAPDLVNRKKALEQTVREIDSSMRRESGKSGGSTR